MNKPLRVVFADDNAAFCEIISGYFSAIDGIEIAGIAFDGAQAYDMIMQLQPDVAVLDIIMPQVDGLGVIEKLNANPPQKMPKIFILSALGQESITTKAISLGTEYYFIKPFDLEILADRIKHLGNTANGIQVDGNAAAAGNMSSPSIDNNPLKSNEIERDVTKILQDIGVPAHIKGFQFLRDAITMGVNDMQCINSITKIIYPSVANRHNTTPQSVEMGIRYAIAVAGNRGQSAIHDSLFGNKLNGFKDTPTNSELIAIIADKLRLSMKE